MSSFDYTDNFNGFNDLINRADFLTEAKIGKAHPSFGGLAKRIKQEVGKGFPRDVRMLIKTVLYYLDIFNDEDLDTLKAAGGAASSSYRLALEGLLDKYQDEIKSRADEITDKLEEEFVKFVNEQKLKVGADRKAAYEAEAEAKAAAKRIEKEIEGGGDIVDVVDDAVGELEQSTADAFETLRAAKEDPTTFIEIKIRDADKASDVSNIVTKYANEDGVEVSGNTVQFSVDPDTPLANAVATHGVDKIEAALKRDVDAISDSVVVVMAPEEDYERMDDEEMGYGLDEPGGVPGSYAMGEEGGGITEVEDNEVEDAEDGITQKPYISMYTDDDGRKVYDVLDKHGKSAYKSYYKKVAEHWLREYYDIMMREDEEDNELDHFLTKEQPEDKIPADYEDVLAALVDDDKKKHAIKRLYGDDDDPGHIDDMRAEYPPDPFGGGYEDEEGVDPGIENQHLLHRSERAALRRGAQLPELPVVNNIDEAINTLTSAGSRFGGPEGSAVTGENNAVKWVTRVLMYNNIEVPDAATIKSRLPGSSTNLIRRSLEVDEEDFNYSPMLDSYKTSTANYLTEQVASDKRNKKTETKNQSFKEKYKPKTSWQLEELRRYGL